MWMLCSDAGCDVCDQPIDLSSRCLGTVRFLNDLSSFVLYFSYTTKNSAWAEIEGVNATNEPIIVSGIMLIVHIYIMSAMSGIIYA